MSARQHGRSRTTEYYIWKDMMQRCDEFGHKDYPNYGGRGIKVCIRWFSFEAFLEDMGKRPTDRTLDRINTNGDYESSNCRWATSEQQNSNRRDNIHITYEGKTLTMAQWDRHLGHVQGTMKR